MRILFSCWDRRELNSSLSLSPGERFSFVTSCGQISVIFTMLSRIKALKPCDILILSIQPFTTDGWTVVCRCSYIVKVNIKQPLFKRSNSMKVYSYRVVQIYRIVMVAWSLPTGLFDWQSGRPIRKQDKEQETTVGFFKSFSNVKEQVGPLSEWIKTPTVLWHFDTLI